MRDLTPRTTTEKNQTTTEVEGNKEIVTITLSREQAKRLVEVIEKIQRELL